MFKKLLLLPIVGLFTLTAFASADTVEFNGQTYQSDSPIIVANYNCGSYGCNYTNQNDFDPNSIVYGIYYYSCPNGLSNSKVASQGMQYMYGSDYSGMPFSLNLNIRHSLELGIDCGVDDTYHYVSPDFAYSIFSKSPITLYVSPENPDDGDSSLIPGSPDGFTSGFKPFVDSFISALSGFIPLVILYGLPILLIYIFWKRIRSYLKHFLIGGELPKGDDIANCRVYIDDKGNIKHDFSVNGYKRAVSMGNLFDQDMNTGNNRNKYSYTEQVAYGQDVYIRHDRSKSVDNAEIMDYTGQFHEAVFIRGSGYVAKRDLDCLNEDMTFNRDKMIKKYKGTNPYDALD